MKEILLNMANHLLCEFCKAHDIDCSGTYCAKKGRGFSYALFYDRPGAALHGFEAASITFHKSSVPTYQWRTI